MAEPPPISILVQTFLKEVQLTQDQAAAAMGVSRCSLNQLCNDRRKITAVMAIKLEALARKHRCSPSWRADWWLLRQMDIDLWEARRAANA